MIGCAAQLLRSVCPPRGVKPMLVQPAPLFEGQVGGGSSGRRSVLHAAGRMNYRPRAVSRARWRIYTAAHALAMKTSARTLLLILKRRDGANGVVATLAGVCAGVLLALFVQTLHVAIERGDALRERQRLALRNMAAPVLRIDTQVSDARIEASR